MLSPPSVFKSVSLSTARKIDTVMFARTFSFLFFFLGVSLPSLWCQVNTIKSVDATILNWREKDQLAAQVNEKMQDSSRWEFQQVSEHLYLEINRESEKTIKLCEWYFEGEVLLYTETSWWNIFKNERLYTEKTYHQDGKLMAWLTSENSFANSNSAEFRQRDRELRELQKKLRQGAGN